MAQKADWTPAMLAEAAGGEILCGDRDTPVETISTDTRNIGPGHCFIALAGENHDGHAFVADAMAKGAAAVIVSKWDGAPLPERCAVIRVGDTLDALGEVARHHRLRFKIPVIAVSGSNGKTSTKEMIASILSQSRRVLKNRGNFNNLIGLPLTLLQLTDEHQAAVVEMGINVPGEMKRLARIGSPDAGVITNVHPAHLQGLESLDRIVEEKGGLWKSLGPEGLAVVNLDDPLLTKFAEGINSRKITWSIKDLSADVHPSGQVLISEGKTTFGIAYRGVEIPIDLPIMGLHHVRNALAAAAAALGAGSSPEDVRAGLAAYEPIKQRMQCLRLTKCLVIDDTYNANPESLLAAAETVAAASAGKPFVAVLGEMRELGPDSPRLHFEAGRKIGAMRPSLLITLGELGIEISKGAMAAGLDASRCFHASDHAGAAGWLLKNMPEGARVLVKGSRGMTMEKVIEELSSGCK